MLKNGRKISANKVTAKERVVCNPPVKGQPIEFVDGYVLTVGKTTLKLHKEEASQIVNSLVSAR